MLLIYKISILLYFISLGIELRYLAVPSEESHTSLMKSGLSSWNLIKFVLGLLGIFSFFMISVSPFVLSNIEFQLASFIIGLSLLTLGRVITFIGSLDINKHLKKNSLTILNQGIFKYTRNPILLGLNISLLGLLISLGNIMLILLSLFFFIGMHIKVLDEEKFLSQKFGVPYREYKKTTKRYI